MFLQTIKVTLLIGFCFSVFANPENELLSNIGKQVENALSTRYRQKTKFDIMMLKKSSNQICERNGCCLVEVGTLELTKGMIASQLPKYKNKIETIQVPRVKIPVRQCESKAKHCHITDRSRGYRKAIVNDLGLEGCCVPTGFETMPILIKFKNSNQMTDINIQTTPNGCKCQS